MKIGKVVHACLERELFPLDRTLKRSMKYDPLVEEVRSAFASNGLVLESQSKLLESSGWKWKIRSGGQTYVVREMTDTLNVSAEKFPIVSSLLSKSVSLAQRLGNFRFISDQLFFRKASIQKKYFDDRSVLMVNIGAGKWYERNWKVIDHSGDWYKYNRSFLDFPIDLMKKTPFPFGDSTVDLFYSEHVFEHFPEEVCEFAFSEIFRTLKKGQGVRIVVPDADILYEKFKDEDQAFYRRWMTSYNASLTEAFVILFAYTGNAIDEVEVRKNCSVMSKADFFNHYTKDLCYDYRRAGEHINWFNFEKMRRMLKHAGLREVAKSNAQESRFMEMRGNNFDTRPDYSLHVDAIK